MKSAVIVFMQNSNFPDKSSQQTKDKCLIDRPRLRDATNWKNL
jgi:hypothetical protein